MSEVRRVIIQLRKPSDRDVGLVSFGYYVIDGETLVMTFATGEPVNPDQDGKGQFRHTLKAGDDPNAIAGVLTRQCRRFLLGISEAEEAFGRPLGYSNSGVA